MTTGEFYQYMVHFAVMMTVLTMMAVYLLVSKRNAFGSEVVADQRLRRKAGWMILVYVLVYLANIPLLVCLTDNPQLMELVSMTLDMALCLPVLFRFMLDLLQDRRRWDNRLWWLSVVAVIPLVGWLLTHQALWSWVVYGLFLAEQVAFVAWFVAGMMVYHRFLADNYADLEHKELVWSWVIVSIMVLSIVNQLLMLYQSSVHAMLAYSYAFHVADTIFIGVIVWRIDHQQVLEPVAEEPQESQEAIGETVNSPVAHTTREDMVIARTGALLRKHCEEAQLYLQRDLSLNAVARACNTNRTYLGLYFASQGITYYIYINQLRIAHFQSLYREVVKSKIVPPTLQQLSADSGFASYNTFSRAFLSCTGISVRQWQEEVKNEE